MKLDPTTIIRAWRDPKFAASLPEPVRAQLPPNPAGGRSVASGDTHRAAVGPLGTLAADCSTASADCKTATNECRTIATSCSTAGASCLTATLGCRTISVNCATASASCNTGAVNCDTRLSCTRAANCQ